MLHFIAVTWLNFSFCNEIDLAVIKKKESRQPNVDIIFNMHSSATPGFMMNRFK